MKIFDYPAAVLLLSQVKLQSHLLLVFFGPNQSGKFHLGFALPSNKLNTSCK